MVIGWCGEAVCGVGRRRRVEWKASQVWGAIELGAGTGRAGKLPPCYGS